jgi:alpha-N-arabinofuranosidase
MITHSATVNHGGGLRKERERVYANPCYHAQRLFAEFAEGKPLKIELQSGSEQAPLVLPDIKNWDKDRAFRSVDALAAQASNGDLLISVVHRGTTGPLRLVVKLDGFPAGDKAQITTLGGTVPWAANTLENPGAVEPVGTEAEVRDGAMILPLQPFSIIQARLVSKR